MDFVAFDLETTGIRADQSDIVEIGAVKFIDGHPHDPFGTLVNPGRPIPADATQVNGITDDMVRGQPPVENILTDLADYCGDLPLVAHNARFDYSFLKAAIVKHQAKAPGGVVLDSVISVWWPAVFTGRPRMRFTADASSCRSWNTSSAAATRPACTTCWSCAARNPCSSPYSARLPSSSACFSACARRIPLTERVLQYALHRQP